MQTGSLTDVFLHQPSPSQTSSWKRRLAAEAHLHLGLEKLKRLVWNWAKIMSSQVLYKEQSVHYNEVKHLKTTLLGIYTAKKIKVTLFN